MGGCVCVCVIKSQCRGILDSGTHPVSFMKINTEKKTMLRLRGLRNLVDIDMGPDIEINIKIDL